MSRERPAEPPLALPDQERGVKNPAIDERHKRQATELARLKRFSGPGFMGKLMATFTRGALERAPQFIRRSYEASIVDALNAFYAARPRPWRQRHRSSCKPTFKERLKMRRQARAP